MRQKKKMLSHQTQGSLIAKLRCFQHENRNMTMIMKLLLNFRKNALEKNIATLQGQKKVERNLE